MKNRSILIPFIMVCLHSFSQNNIDNVLAEILLNNKTLQVNKQFWEAKTLEYKTGLTLQNPIINYDFMIGRPVTAGNQSDFTATQSFDFPSVYQAKKQISNTKIAEIENQISLQRQQILLEAKKICIDLVYLNKLHIQYQKRKENIEKLLENFEMKAQKGDATMLEVNKAQLLLIEINKKTQLNQVSINLNNQNLVSLNAGKTIVFSDTVYSLNPILVNFENLEKDIESKDNMLKILQREKILAENQIQLAKATTLPKFELGYHYQGILGQQFNGVHLGLTIPLWENKNLVKSAQSNAIYSEFVIENHRTEHFYEVKNLYEKYVALKNSLEQYQVVFTSFNNTELLNKSLSYGEITAIDYFMEIGYYYSVHDSYLETENQMNQVLVELSKYDL